MRASMCGLTAHCTGPAHSPAACQPACLHGREQAILEGPHLTPTAPTNHSSGSDNGGFSQNRSVRWVSRRDAACLRFRKNRQPADSGSTESSLRRNHAVYGNQVRLIYTRLCLTASTNTQLDSLPTKYMVFITAHVLQSFL